MINSEQSILLLCNFPEILVLRFTQVSTDLQVPMLSVSISEAMGFAFDVLTKHESNGAEKKIGASMRLSAPCQL